MRKKIGCVYVIKFDNGVKVGYSKDFLRRLETYLHPWCRPIESVYYAETPFPQFLESQLKRRLGGRLKMLPSCAEYTKNMNVGYVVGVLEQLRHLRPDKVARPAGQRLPEIVYINMVERVKCLPLKVS